MPEVPRDLVFPEKKEGPERCGACLPGLSYVCMLAHAYLAAAAKLAAVKRVFSSNAQQ